MAGKIIIISAPSGCGKSTIINAIMTPERKDLTFSVSATNRSPRPGEVHGVNYYYLTDEEFRRHIEQGDFVEYEEVYPGRFYGTLRSEIESKCAAGLNVILDIDVKGGVNVKEMFGDRAMSVFVEPPSVDELRRRLEGRATDSPEVINERVARADYELTFAPRYDRRVVNDNLPEAIEATRQLIDNFINE